MKIKRFLMIILFVFIGIFSMLAFQQLQTKATLTKEQMTDQVENVYQGTVKSFIKKEDHYIVSFEKNGSTYEVQIDPYNGELSNMQAIFITDKPIVAVKEDSANSNVTSDSGDGADPKSNPQPRDSTKAGDTTKPSTNTDPSNTKTPDDTAKPNTNTKPKTNTTPGNSTKPGNPTKPSDNSQKETPTTPIKPLLSEAQAKAIALKEINGEVDSVDYNETSDGGHYLIEIEPANAEHEEAIVVVHAVTGKILSIEFED